MPQSYASRTTLKTIVMGGTNTRVVAAASYWRLIGVLGFPQASHAVYISTSQNFSAASGAIIPAPVTLSGGTASSIIGSYTWIPWPPGVDMWAVGSSANGVSVIELPLPPGVLPIS